MKYPHAALPVSLYFFRGRRSFLRSFSAGALGVSLGLAGAHVETFVARNIRFWRRSVRHLIPLEARGCSPIGRHHLAARLEPALFASRRAELENNNERAVSVAAADKNLAVTTARTRSKAPLLRAVESALLAN